MKIINFSCINFFNTEKIPDTPSANTGKPLPELPGETNTKRSLGRLLSTLREPRKAAFHAWRMRLSFGRGMESGILSHEIATKSSGNTPLMQIMQQYAHDIGSNLSAQEIERYINIGEYLVRAITQGRLQEDNKLRIPKENGGERIVQSNLETARAISWYLQAKGVMDHASPDLDPHLLNRGSMLVADQDSHLFRFLNSAPNTHGRISTHFNERSTSEPPTLSTTGVLGKAGSLFSPSATAQRAIEDFSKRMPSGKGNMTFDRLQENDGTPLLFLKWETVGVPTKVDIEAKLTTSESFGSITPQNLRTWREKNRTLKTAGKDKFESLTPANAGKADSPEIATLKMNLADWLRTDPIENSAKQGFAKADSRRITGEETDEEEIYEDDRTSFSSKDYSSEEEPEDHVNASKSAARPAPGRAVNSSPSKWEKDVLEVLKKHTPATDEWIRENNYAVAKNHGSGMNCLLIALLQHATGRYNDQHEHEQQAQQIRAQLEERHEFTAPGGMLSVFSNDDPILRDAVQIINDLHNTSLDPVIVYPTEGGHPNKGIEGDEIEIASQKNLIVYGRHDDLHFEALRKMPAATA